MSETKEQSPDTEQAAILERLLVDRRRPNRVGWVRWLLQLALFLALVWLISLFKRPVPSLSLWDFQEPELVLRRMQTAAGHFAIQTLIFFLLGLILPLAFRRRRAPQRRTADRELTVEVRPSRRQAGSLPGMLPMADTARSRGLVRRVWRWTARFVLQASLVCVFLLATFAASVAIALMLVNTIGLSSAVDVGLALLGVSVGIWVGWWCSQGWSGLARLLSQATAFVVIVFCGGLWLKTQIAQAEPYGFPALKVTSADKRKLVDAVRQQSATWQGQRVYHLTPEHLSKLLAWWIAVQSSDSKALVELSDVEQKVSGSLRIPARFLGSRPYLNVSVTGWCGVADEQLELDLHSVQVGAITIPEAVIGPLGRYLAQRFNDDPVSQDLLVGVSGVSVHRDGIDLFIASDGAEHQRWSKIVQKFNNQPDYAPAVRCYLTAFAEVAQGAKPKDPLFEPVVRRAFELARERSQDGSAVAENRAAILALGIALGTLKLDKYVGDVWQPGTEERVASIASRSLLHRRADWPRHFWVSGALTVSANSLVSDVLGLLKEEVDAGPGGSGFSFGDLAADRAGTAFASAATHNARSARAIQDWVLAPGTDLQDLMPIADNLDEGLSDAEMLQKFDGIDGKRYQETIDDIHRRVMELPWSKQAE
ncbi:MAG: hypothetical protein ACYC3X_15545 [Pirellulaceae bacterium]